MTRTNELTTEISEPSNIPLGEKLGMLETGSECFDVCVLESHLECIENESIRPVTDRMNVLDSAEIVAKISI